MSATITHLAGTIVPELIDGYTASREARTIVHDIINRSNPDVTLRAPGLRRGSFRCLFPVQGDAIAAYGTLGTPQVFTITDPEVPAVGMSFVVAEGDLDIELDDETRAAWWVIVPFVEVNP